MIRNAINTKLYFQGQVLRKHSDPSDKQKGGKSSINHSVE